MSGTRIVEQSERYYPQTITALDSEGRTVVRASQHQAEDGWTVIINTAPRSLPDLSIGGKGTKSNPLVRQLVEVLAEAIEARGWMPTYSTDLVRGGVGWCKDTPTEKAADD